MIIEFFYNLILNQGYDYNENKYILIENRIILEFKRCKL